MPQTSCTALPIPAQTSLERPNDVWDCMGNMETPLHRNETNVSCSYLEVEERCSAYLLLQTVYLPQTHKDYMGLYIQVYFTE